jgi:hypothetical protein
MVYDILNQIKCRTIIIDLCSISDPPISAYVNAFAEFHDISVIRLCHRLLGGTFAKEIGIPSVFGLYYVFSPAPID